MQSVIDAITWIATWLSSGIVDFFKDAGTWLMAKAVVSYIDTKIWFIQFAWGVAKQVLDDLGVFNAIFDAFTALPPDVAAALRFFKVPDAINVVLTGGMTKFVMRFIPFA